MNLKSAEDVYFLWLYHFQLKILILPVYIKKYIFLYCKKIVDGFLLNSKQKHFYDDLCNTNVLTITSVLHGSGVHRIRLWWGGITINVINRLKKTFITFFFW